MTMENTNCLEGYGCPCCMSLGPFKMSTNCYAVWSDDGVAELSDAEIDEHGTTTCLACGLTMATARIPSRYRRLYAALYGDLEYIKKSKKLLKLVREGYIPLEPDSCERGDVYVGVTQEDPDAVFAYLPRIHHPRTSSTLQPFTVTKAVMNRWRDVVAERLGPAYSGT